MLADQVLANGGQDPLTFKSSEPVGTGPYRIRSWLPGGNLVLEAFPGHRQPLHADKDEQRLEVAHDRPGSGFKVGLAKDLFLVGRHGRR